MLGVTVPAAALFFPTLLSHHKVVTAVVAENATTKPKKNIKVCKKKKKKFKKHLDLKRCDMLHFEKGESPPAVMSAQPPGELAPAAKAVCGLLIH